MPSEIVDNLDIIGVSRVEEVLELALLKNEKSKNEK